MDQQTNASFQRHSLRTPYIPERNVDIENILKIYLNKIIHFHLDCTEDLEKYNSYMKTNNRVKRVEPATCSIQLSNNVESRKN